MANFNIQLKRRNGASYDSYFPEVNPAQHNHNDIYYTESEVDALIAGVGGGAINQTWKIIRAHSAGSILTQVCSGTTGGSISVTEDINGGDVIAMELNNYDNADAIPKVVIVKIDDEVDIAPDSLLANSSGFITGVSTNVYTSSFNISSNGSTIYFDNSKRNSATTTTVSDADLYVGQIWKIGAE